ncbi:hypothetical protein BGZ61DRAFT_445928 [Ilyonectria robusta]|uniref:uncharacterized protein n=1 Tax=Ilyonectria robusta TaxID=1079257 RepID=UPI001E8E0358|nr:uncharacterized protein BGZ61DRAFT_445928 [Ilyonectria robusta]KAH8729168.1 hypothetical protein BGZ61DRAFT_445928 [Ilyonectria robusta]
MPRQPPLLHRHPPEKRTILKTAEKKAYATSRFDAHIFWKRPTESQPHRCPDMVGVAHDTRTFIEAWLERCQDCCDEGGEEVLIIPNLCLNNISSTPSPKKRTRLASGDVDLEATPRRAVGGLSDVSIGDSASDSDSVTASSSRHGASASPEKREIACGRRRTFLSEGNIYFAHIIY